MLNSTANWRKTEADVSDSYSTKSFAQEQLEHGDFGDTVLGKPLPQLSLKKSTAELHLTGRWLSGSAWSFL